MELWMIKQKNLTLLTAKLWQLFVSKKRFFMDVSDSIEIWVKEVGGSLSMLGRVGDKKWTISREQTNICSL